MSCFDGSLVSNGLSFSIDKLGHVSELIRKSSLLIVSQFERLRRSEGRTSQRTILCPNGQFRSIQVRPREFERIGAVARTGQAAMERFQRTCLVPMGITKARRNVNDLRQSVCSLGWIFFLGLTKLRDTQPVPPRINDTESTHGAVLLPRSGDARDACDRHLATCIPQSGRKVTIETVRVRHSHDLTAIRSRRIETFDAEEMDPYVLEGDDCVRVGTYLSVRSLEPD
jgi:hypothetical protein